MILKYFVFLIVIVFVVKQLNGSIDEDESPNAMMRRHGHEYRIKVRGESSGTKIEEKQNVLFIAPFFNKSNYEKNSIFAELLAKRYSVHFVIITNKNSPNVEINKSIFESNRILSDNTFEVICVKENENSNYHNEDDQIYNNNSYSAFRDILEKQTAFIKRMKNFNFKMAFFDITDMGALHLFLAIEIENIIGISNTHLLPQQYVFSDRKVLEEIIQEHINSGESGSEEEQDELLSKYEKMINTYIAVFDKMDKWVYGTKPKSLKEQLLAIEHGYLKSFVEIFKKVGDASKKNFYKIENIYKERIKGIFINSEKFLTNFLDGNIKPANLYYVGGIHLNDVKGIGKNEALKDLNRDKNIQVIIDFENCYQLLINRKNLTNNFLNIINLYKKDFINSFLDAFNTVSTNLKRNGQKINFIYHCKVNEGDPILYELKNKFNKIEIEVVHSSKYLKKSKEDLTKLLKNKDKDKYNVLNKEIEHFIQVFAKAEKDLFDKLGHLRRNEEAKPALYAVFIHFSEELKNIKEKLFNIFKEEEADKISKIEMVFENLSDEFKKSEADLSKEFKDIEQDKFNKIKNEFEHLFEELEEKEKQLSTNFKNTNKDEINEITKTAFGHLTDELTKSKNDLCKKLERIDEGNTSNFMQDELANGKTNLIISNCTGSQIIEAMAFNVQILCVPTYEILNINHYEIDKFYEISNLPTRLKDVKIFHKESTSIMEEDTPRDLKRRREESLYANKRQKIVDIDVNVNQIANFIEIIDEKLEIKDIVNALMEMLTTDKYKEDVFNVFKHLHHKWENKTPEEVFLGEVENVSKYKGVRIN